MNLKALEQAFYANFDSGKEVGASVSVWQNGAELLTLNHGHTNSKRDTIWTERTIIPVFSATKGPSAATLLLSLDEAGMNLDTAVQRVWREFPISDATFGDMISHQCGLSAIDSEIDIADYDAIIHAIERQVPHWELGSQHGYHPRLIGFMQDECVRRISGISLGQYWQERIATPLELDFWIGLPESEHHRVATLLQGKISADQLKSGFYREIASGGTLVNRSFRSPRGLQGASDMNRPAAWQGGYPAMGGVGSARALASFYQATMGYAENTPFHPILRQQMNERRCNGYDHVLMDRTSFGGGFMLDPVDETGSKTRHLIGSDTAGYGHPGAGGSHAFADPATGVSFAYVMNQMEVSVLPGKKVQSLIEALNLGENNPAREI